MYNEIIFTKPAAFDSVFFRSAKPALNFPTAFFVKLPYTIDDLVMPHRPVTEKPYMVEKTVFLPRIDYENFVTDLCVDRWFIEQNRSLCQIDDDDIWHCILVKRAGSRDGILVMSGGCVFPYWAAYLKRTSSAV